MKLRKVTWTVVKLVFGVVVAVVILMLLYRFALDAYDYGYRIFAETPVSPSPGLTVSVAIVEGKSVREIGDILEEKGLIRSATLFYLEEMFSSYHDKLQPGIYELSTSMTPEEMMAIMAERYGEKEEEETVVGNSETSSYLEEDLDVYTEDEDVSEDIVIYDNGGVE